MIGKIIKEACAAAGTIVFIVLLTMSFGIIPALGNFLNPFGIWTVPGNATYQNMMLSDPSLNGTVTIQFDEYGIPHIHAITDRDLFFAVGYLHASQRLFEMDMFRRAATGKLSELIGESMVSTDKYFRILGFNRHAQLGVAYIQENESEQYQLLQAYANGVNRFINSLTPWTMPLEYKLLEAIPEPWTVFDTIVFKYLQAWDLSGNLADLETTLLKEKLPASMYAELYPNNTVGEPFIPPIIQELTTLQDKPPSPMAQTINGIKTLEESRLRLFGPFGAEIGSNNWAVNGSKTPTGNPLLAGDPHLGYQQPSLWYEVHMMSDEGYNCTGVTFPAAPVILIGQNDHVAWSLTNVGGDAHVDFYEEKMNSTHYYFNGTWKPLQIHNEIIHVKGGTSITFKVRETVHGPLITDHDIVTNVTQKGFSGVKLNISLKWTGTHVTLGENYSNEFLGLYLMNKATNFSSFNEGLRWFGAMQNCIYADDAGNIAMTVTGPFPIRKQGVSGTPDGSLKGDVVQNGTGVGEEWAGFIPFNELPREVNPSRGWVGSANQWSINGSYPYYIGENTFDDGWRCRRIRDLLEASDSFTIADFEAIQGDNYAYSASQFLPILLDVWNYSVNVNGDTYEQSIIDAMNVLAAWNGSFIYDKDFIAPTIWEEFLRQFQRNTWDEFASYDATRLRMPRITILENLTKFQPNSIWFDDNNTAGIQDRNWTMLKSFNATVASLTTAYGEMTNWIWGNHHQIYVEHLTGIASLSSPHIPIDGGSDILNNQWETGGPSWRMVVDLGNATTPDKAAMIYPGGQSGNPVSEHYLDLFYMYVNYQYHTVYRTMTGFTPEATWTFTP
ncbi:MAG: penicillin acylase family protein [Candidatus Helarchaeota archaeon]